PWGPQLPGESRICRPRRVGVEEVGKRGGGSAAGSGQLRSSCSKTRGVTFAAVRTEAAARTRTRLRLSFATSAAMSTLIAGIMRDQGWAQIVEHLVAPPLPSLPPGLGSKRLPIVLGAITDA